MTIEHTVTYKGTDYHSAFPDIIRLQNGDLITIFRQVPLLPGTGVSGDPHEKLLHHHEDPLSRTVLVRSTDDGRTWDPASHMIVDALDTYARPSRRILPTSLVMAQRGTRHT